MGGSTMQWNPEHKIGFGYATTNFYTIDMMNKRASVMQQEIVDTILQK
jgi:hypothetical protein